MRALYRPERSRSARIRYASPGSRLLRSTPGSWYVSRLLPDELHPGADCGEAAEVETPFFGDVGVGVESHVGDRVAVRDEVVVARKVLLHHPEGGVAKLPLLLQHLFALVRHLHAEVGPGARHGDVRLVAVLLEEHPLQDLRPLEPSAREVRRTFREEEQDRAGFGEESAILGLEHRDAAVGVDLLEKARGARLAPGEVVLDALERDAELREEETDLVAVAGDQGV